MNRWRANPGHPGLAVILAVAATVLFLVPLFPTKLLAVATPGTAEVDIHWVKGGSTGVNFTFTVNNPEGGTTVNWVRIICPNANFTLTAGSASGWVATVTADQVAFTGGTIPGGASGSFTTVASIAAVDTAQASWTVQVSDTGGPAQNQTDTPTYPGALDTGIDNSPPTNVGISSVTADSQTQLTAYAQTAQDSGSGLASTPYWFSETTGNPGGSSSTSWQALTTFVDTGLSPSTQYCYQVRARDAVGNESSYSSQVCQTTQATPDTSPPVISNISAGSITQTGATITWTTDEGATSQVEYGKTIGYGNSTPEDSNIVTSHLVNLSGLSSDTAYHFRVKSKDAAGNPAASGDNIFTTLAGEGPELEEPFLGTPTVSAPAIPDDETPPVVILEPIVPNPTSEACAIVRGETTEDRGIVSALQYSLDDGQTWHPITNISGLGTKRATFEFTTPPLEDGNYSVRARARDNSNNIGISDAQTLIIDRLPPIFGGNLLTVGPQVLTPSASGIIETAVGLEQKMILSTRGGPIKVELLADEKSFPLEFSPDMNLWLGEVKFEESGDYLLKVNAEDGAGNKAERVLNRLSVASAGYVYNRETQEPVGGAEISLFFFEPVTETWVLWDAASYDQKNPTATESGGKYNFLVPAGRYYLEAKAEGYRKAASEIFEFSKSSLVNLTIPLNPRPRLTIGPLTFFLPSFLDFETVRQRFFLSPVAPDIPEERSELLQEGTLAPSFELANLKNESVSLDTLSGPLLLTFGATWNPLFSEQILVLDRLEGVSFYVVFAQESSGVVEAFMRRGGYDFPVLVDRDGEIAGLYKLGTLPLNVFLDAEKLIKDFHVGVLEEEAIREKLLSP